MILVFVTTFLIMIAARESQGIDSYAVWWCVFLPYIAGLRAKFIKERFDGYAYTFGGSVLFYIFFHMTHFDKYLISGGPLELSWLNQSWLNGLGFVAATGSVLALMWIEFIARSKR